MNRRRFAIVMAAFLALHPPDQARGQSPPPAGARIRVRVADTELPSGSERGSAARLVGQLDRVGDSLWIRLDAGDGPVLAIDRAAIQQLEMSNGRKRNPGKGALWGAGVGLGLGVLAVAALDDCALGGGNWWFDLCDGDEDVLVLGSMAAGAAWGTLIGFLITSERWVTVPATSLTLRAMPGGIGLAFDVRLPH